MVPGQKFDKPGKSPFMDMLLVPVYADDGERRRQCAISPRVQQNLGIRTAEVVDGNARAAGRSGRQRRVQRARRGGSAGARRGFVEKLHVRAPLDPVRKGQPLADLYVPDWVAAQEEFLAVQRMQGERSRGASRRGAPAHAACRHERGPDPHGRIDAAGARRASRLTAPIDGVVVELAAREGMTVMAGAPLFRINGLSTVWVNAEVPESRPRRCAQEPPSRRARPALPASTFKGQVSAILPEVNRRDAHAEGAHRAGQPGRKLVPGMFVTVQLHAQPRQAVLLVPSEAVIQTGERTVVDRWRDSGRQALPSGRRRARARKPTAMTEIRKGLEAGQKVVVSGQFLIDSEASLKATTRPARWSFGATRHAPTSIRVTRG